MIEVFVLGGNSEFYVPQPIQNTIVEYVWKDKQKTKETCPVTGHFFPIRQN